MKHYLIPNSGQFYKANLHAHTTVSDGAHTPKELKEKYKKQGYSILAMTDHELLVDHSDLDDADFLTITSYEYAVCEKEYYRDSKTMEFNLFAKNQHNVTQVCFDPSTVKHGELWRVPNVKYAGDICKKEYSLCFLQNVIDEARKNGFLVSLNHPHYSMETPDFFGNLNGLFAMEIYNHNSFVGCGVDDYNPQMYDNMLRKGKNLYCIAADDCHSARWAKDPLCDSFGGFVMIKADRLEYGVIMDALESGNFYASQGPLINELYIDDGKVFLHCSDAKYVVMVTNDRASKVVAAPIDKTINEAVFMLPSTSTYMRFDVIDEFGKHANTRAYPVKFE